MVATIIPPCALVKSIKRQIHRSDWAILPIVGHCRLAVAKALQRIRDEPLRHLVDA